MKQIAEFLKMTVIGGLFVLLPVLLLSMLLAEALQLVVALATPIADLFPMGVFDQAEAPVLIALILIVGVSFLLGLALRSAALSRLGGWIESTVLSHLPAYTVLKRLTKGFAKEEAATFKPGLLISAEGWKDIVYVVEDHGDGQLTVLVPWAPAAFSGSVKVVDRERVEKLDANLGDVSKVLSLWGMGTRDLMGKGNAIGKGKE
ncbi:MAG: hypothetical protein ABF291_13090 [Desulfobacterales bacterium]